MRLLKFRRSFVLAAIAFLATLSLPSVRALEPLPFVEIPLYVGESKQTLGIYEGDNVNEAVDAFGATHDLSPDELKTLKEEVTKRFVAIADVVRAGASPGASFDGKEPLFQFPVGVGDGKVVPLKLYEGDNLLRAVQKFAKKNGVPEDIVPSLFQQIQLKVYGENFDDPTITPLGGGAPGDASADPEAPPQLLYEFPVDVDGSGDKDNLTPLKLYRGDVLGERVKAFAEEHALDDEASDKLVAAVAERIAATQQAEKAAEEIRAKREAEALAAGEEGGEPPEPLYEIPINVDDDTYPLKLYEGDILRTAVEAFVIEHGFEITSVPIIVDAVSKQFNKDDADADAADDDGSPKPLVSFAVSMDGGDGKPLPPIALYDNEDADVVANEYCEKHGLDVKVTAPQLADALRNSLKEKTPAEKAEAPAAAATEEEKGDATTGEDKEL
jgi:hypothetical protein